MIHSPVLFHDHLLSIFDLSPSPIFICSGSDLVVEYANKATLIAWNKSDTVIGRPIIEGVPELKVQDFPDLLSGVYNTGIPYSSEDHKMEFIVEGVLQTYYFKFSYQPLRAKDGTIWGVLSHATDVTELIKAQKRLKANQRYLKSMILQAPVAICILKGPSFNVEIANDKMIELWGTTSEILGKPIFEGLPEAKGQGLEQILGKVYITGKPFVASERPVELPRNGKIETVYVNFVYEAVKDDNNVVGGVMAIATDVTDLVLARVKVEQSEKQFRKIADSMPQMVWVTDPQGFHEYFNQRWYDFTCTEFDDVKGEGWADLFHPDDRSIAWAKWNHALATGEIYEVEYRLKNGKTGDYIWMLGRAVPIYDDQGAISRWFGTCTDIHEQIQIQQKKDDFIGIASHELKTPLTTLKSSVQLVERIVQKTPGFESLKKFIALSTKSMDKVTYLVEDLLNVTKLKEGHLSLNHTEFILFDVIHESYQSTRFEGIHTILIKGEMNLKVRADAHRIDQVITNFINNAIKYGPNSREIHITIERVMDKAKVSVTDQGPGISPQKIPYLFDRYYRAEEDGIIRSGLGLGLYISAEIIKRHNGEIGVESELGKGSTFWFTLPLTN